MPKLEHRMKYTKNRDASLRAWEIFREDKEGGEVAKGVSFSVMTSDKAGYPVIPIQKLMLPDSLIKYIIQEFKK